jgi:Family of unknown function (DUF6489)
MKVTVEVDCTPEEARAFLGLPDVRPMQAAVLARIEQQTLQAADSFTPDAMLRTWFSTMPQVSTQMQDMFSRMMGAAPTKP